MWKVFEFFRGLFSVDAKERSIEHLANVTYRLSQSVIAEVDGHRKLINVYEIEKLMWEEKEVCLSLGNSMMDSFRRVVHIKRLQDNKVRFYLEG